MQLHLHLLAAVHISSVQILAELHALGAKLTHRQYTAPSVHSFHPLHAGLVNTAAMTTVDGHVFAFRDEKFGVGIVREDSGGDCWEEWEKK